MFSPDEIFVFLGPTLSIKEAQGHLDARYFPPAKQGDILSHVVQFKPKVVLLIDGYFMQNLSVWHKEILYALDRGVHVMGASSMGALRAAETSIYGMVGIGKIYQLYRDGIVNDDDEVALAHGPSEQGYIALSLPLINIRFTLERAQQKEQIPQIICDQVLASARSLYYPERTIEQIAFSTKKHGLSETEVTRWLENYYVDQKKEDALLALKLIQTGAIPQARECGDFLQTPLFQTLYNYDRQSCVSSTSISQGQVARYVALNHPGFAELQFHAFNQALVNFLAELLKIEVTEEEIEGEKSRFCLRNEILLLSDEEWNEWLINNHLTREDFHALMQESAKARKMHGSFIMGQFPWKHTKLLLDALRLKNTYEKWCKRAAHQEQALHECNPYYADIDHPELESEELIEMHLQEGNWRPDRAYTDWAEEAGFQNTRELRAEIHKAKIIREEKDRRR